MINGIINIYKEPGFTSHDVVAKLRGILKQKKIGHTGTLDPQAVGVLPVCLGSGTKLCDMLTDKSKEYVAEFVLGISTDTQDTTGKVLQTRPVTIGREMVEEAVLSFQGTYEQIPPMYSALKVNGQKLYQLARQGKEIERQPRSLEIHEIEILDITLPKVLIRVDCSKGTYIRTLCHDIGEKLGTGAAMSTLKRTRSGQFLVKDSLTLAEVETLQKMGEIATCVMEVDSLFAGLTKVTVKKEFQKLIDNGNSFYTEQCEHSEYPKDAEEVRVYNTDNCFYGIYEYKMEENRFKPVKMFLENNQ